MVARTDDADYRPRRTPETRWSQDSYIVLDDTVTEKEGDDDDESDPVKYLAPNKIGAPTARIIRSYAMCWRIETFFERLGTVRSKASSLRANLEHSLKEAVYNLLSWVRDNDEQGIDDLMQEIDQLFVHSTADANVQS